MSQIIGFKIGAKTTNKIEATEAMIMIQTTTIKNCWKLFVVLNFKIGCSWLAISLATLTPQPVEAIVLKIDRNSLRF